MPDMKKVEVFGAGTWNGMRFDMDDLEEIVTTTNARIQKGTHKPALKLGHSTNQILQGQKDGDPALGHAVNFRVHGRKIVADFVNMPDIIYKAIDKRRYTSVSVELTYIQEMGTAIKAVALLGADIRAVKSLQDLEQFLSEQVDPVEQPQAEHSLVFSEPQIELEVIKGQMPDAPSNEMSLREEILQLKSQNKDAEHKFSQIEAEKQALEKQLRDQGFEQEKVKVLSAYKKAVEEKRLEPAVFSEIERHIDSQKDTWQQGQGLHFSIDLTDKIAKSMKPAEKEMAFSAGEQPSTEPRKQGNLTFYGDKVVQEIAIIQGKTGKSYEEAAEIAFAANPQLAKDYQEEVNKFYGYN